MKYGITIEDNYTFSDGKELWSKSKNNSYHNDIAAIVKDAKARLEQLKSASQNTDAAVTMEISSFSGDFQAIAWGNNNKELSKGKSNGNATYSDASNRTWKVEKNGSPGAVTVSFDLSMLNMLGGEVADYALLIDKNDDFTSGATAHTSGAKLDGNMLTFTSVKFDDGVHFTLAQKDGIAFPGGVSASIEMWLKADEAVFEDTKGIDGVEANDEVKSWHDQSGNDFNVLEAGAKGTKPRYNEADMNFNPSIKFSDDGDRHLASASNPVDGDMAWYIVYQSAQRESSNSFWINPAIIGAENDGTVNDYTISHRDGKPFFKGTAGDNFGCESKTNRADRRPVILGAIRKKQKNTTNSLYVNGQLEATYAGDDYTLSDPSSVGIGNHDDPVSGSQFSGRIAEVINFSTDLSQTDRYKIESYLAIKYGMSVDHDYVNTVGDEIWDYSENKDFHHHITGIGRDDETGLDQRQSRNYEATSMVTLGHKDIAASNRGNSNGFSVNKSYVICGSDNDVLTGATEVDQGTTTNDEIIDRRIARTWKLHETGTVGDLEINFDLRNFPGVIMAAQTYDFTELRLLVDDDGVFANGATSISPTSYNYSATDTSITFHFDFSTGYTYFSLGTLDEAGSPLPVDFIDFTATPENGQVVLEWSTATETNNDRFEVQRSENGALWETLDEVEGAGTVITRQDYTSIDFAPLPSTTYYRIKQMDFDGTTDFSKIVEINPGESESGELDIISAYPNPFDYQLSIDLYSPVSERVSLEIINSSGSIVYTEEQTLMVGNQTLQLNNLSGLQLGSYILRVRNSTTFKTERLIKR